LRTLIAASAGAPAAVSGAGDELTVVTVDRLATRATASTRSIAAVASRMKSSVGAAKTVPGASAFNATISVRLPPNSSRKRS